MNATGFRSWPISFAGLCTAAALLISCSAPDRLKNEDISVEATKSIVRDRLISPIDNQDIVEFNQRIPRRSILQVIHAPDSLSDPTFLQVIEDQLASEVAFKNEQMEKAGIETASVEKPRILSEDAKQRIIKTRSDARLKQMFDKGLALETYLFGKLREMERNVDEQFLKTVPLNSNTEQFPAVIGGNLTEDPNGYLSLPADIYLIGGRNSAFISKTAMMADFVRDSDFSLAVRELPLQDVLSILAQTLELEYSLSAGVEELDRVLSISIQASALSILDALLTQHSLAILFDSNLDVARFYTDDELVLLDESIKSAIRGHNELLFNQKNLQRAENDLAKINEMIDTSQLLLSGDDKGFDAGIKGFPRSSMGPIATDALLFLSEENFRLRQQLNRFDADTAALLKPKMVSTNSNLSNQTSGLSLNDILVADSCIKAGRDIFVEKIAVYNANKTMAKQHLESYFSANGTAPVAAVQDDDDDIAGGEAGTLADGDNATAGDGAVDNTGATAAAAAAATTETAVATQQTEAPAATNDGCSNEPYAVTFQEDSTGLIVRGRRYDNSLAVRLIEEYDVPRLQVLVEIFMVTVSRDFSRQISNLITSATNGQGGSDSVEASLLTTPTVTAGGQTISTDFLTQITSAIEEGYAVSLQSPNGLISSALSFIESNKLGRVLSSPTILVEDGQDAEISRTQVAKIPFDDFSIDNTSQAQPQIETESAPFSLKLSGVNVYPANRTVQMKVEINNKVFSVPDMNKITKREDADFTEDKISTQFTTAPGDVIVLAGLASNSEASTTRGLPGTTGLGTLSPLVGGSDSVSTNLNEMIIFMAPTVIDPSSGFQPHSAIKGNVK